MVVNSMNRSNKQLLENLSGYLPNYKLLII